jgi:resuscitation-promoting factor RpfB
MELGAGAQLTAITSQPSAKARRTTTGRLLTAAAWVFSATILVGVVVASSRWLGRSSIPIAVSVDNEVEVVYTMRPDVGSLLADLGLHVLPEDLLTPSPDTAIAAPGLSVSLRRARPYQLYVDGAVHEVFSQAQTIGDLLSETGARLYPGDEIWLEGAIVDPGTLLPALAGTPCVGCASIAAARPPWQAAAVKPRTRLELRRAVPLHVDDGSVPFTIRTTAPTVGEALLREGVLLYLGDTVQPSLGSPVRADLRVMIERSRSLLITEGGRTVRTRTQRDTVGDALVDLGVVVAGSDRAMPSLAEPVIDNMEIRVVRVLETVQVERRLISYESLMAPDDQLEIDKQRLAQAGQDGEFRRRIKVEYEDGVETSRELIDEWVAAEPVTRIVSYGRKIVSRPLETPEGTLNYWRKVEMYATAYSAATSGTPRSAPWYGRTRIGLQLRKGLVAVDPKVIPLGTRVYVPGYGVGLAADTGGGVRGRMIDLGYDDWNLQSWHWWVDVYILDPPSPSSSISWVLPKYPEGRFPYRRN